MVSLSNNTFEKLLYAFQFANDIRHPTKFLELKLFETIQIPNEYDDISHTYINLFLLPESKYNDYMKISSGYIQFFIKNGFAGHVINKKSMPIYITNNCDVEQHDKFLIAGFENKKIKKYSYFRDVIVKNWKEDDDYKSKILSAIIVIFLIVATGLFSLLIASYLGYV